MKKQTRSKSGVFLIELLISIGIFSICAAVCIHLLSVAESERRYSENLNTAMNIAAACADSFKSGNDIEQIKKELPNEAESFRCTFTIIDDGGTKALDIMISDDANEYIHIKAARKGDTYG